MLDYELRKSIELFKAEHGSGVRLSTLLRDLPALEPVYSPRGKPENPAKAEEASKTRSMETLYNHLLKAVVTDKLTLSDEDGKVDMGAISEAHGGSHIKDAFIPDYIVELDQKFFEFCQSLPYTIGGRKNAAGAKPGERSPNSQKLYDALKKLEKANGQSAKEFLAVYRELQVPMKLPKLDD